MREGSKQERQDGGEGAEREKMRREVSWNQSGKKKRLQEGGKQERRKTEPRERAKGVVKKAAGAEEKKTSNADHNLKGINNSILRRSCG